MLVRRLSWIKRIIDGSTILLLGALSACDPTGPNETWNGDSAITDSASQDSRSTDSSCTPGTSTCSTTLAKTIESSLALAVDQYLAMDQQVPDSELPRSTLPDGTLWTEDTAWWTAGFFPGSLWYLYEYSGAENILIAAMKRTSQVEPEKFNSSDHDIGFKIQCSFGNQLRLTGDELSEDVIITAADTLMKRFNPTVGCIRSWGNIDDTSKFTVIIDNMMNLELLFNAARLSGNQDYFNAAVSHADKTLQHHFRPDHSSYHVVEYDIQTGTPQLKRTAQGYSNESAWARGQSWGLYGFVVAYRETGFIRYLEQARNIAHFLLEHPNLPDDGIPYWDYDAPDIPNTWRDASAAAIMASALIELSTMTNCADRDFYLRHAQQILCSLSSPSYRSAINENSHFLLKHSVGSLPGNSEIDVPLTYADYYYLEAMTRLRRIKQ